MQPVVVIDFVEEKTFEEKLSGAVQRIFGGWEQLERSWQIRRGNNFLKKEHLGLSDPAYQRVTECTGQAQYGRTCPTFVHQVLQLLQVTPDDHLVDLGSGVGSVVLQAAATVGCRATGIEMCVGRHKAALEISGAFPTIPVTLLHGDFRDYLEMCRSATVLFVNNAHGVFSASRSGKKAPSLDWHVAQLVCGMADGTRVMCYDALLELDSEPLSQCFTKTTHLSPPGGTSWTTEKTPFCVYVKKANEWKCSLCGTKHPLAETECCSNRFYSLRSKRIRM